MTDIVKRLRHTEEETATIGQELVYLQVPVNPDGPEAADEIEKLQKDILAYWNEMELMRSDLAIYSEEIERLRLLVHYAFCEGQITPFLLEDWINSRSYAALKEGE